MIRCKENLEVFLWETYLLDADAAVDATVWAMISIAVLSFGFFSCSVFSVAETALEAAFSGAIMSAAKTTTAASGYS